MKRATRNNIGVAQQHEKAVIIASFLILSLFVACQTTNSQTVVQDNSIKTYKLPPNLNKYFDDKYKNQITDISSGLQETPNGPRGTLLLQGHIKPQNVKTASGDKYARARAIAMAFLKEEAELFGLPNLNELHESDIRASMLQPDGINRGEYIHITYYRYIGDVPLANENIGFSIGPDESIQYVTVLLVPLPPATYQAVTKKTLTEDDARKIVARDLKDHGSDINTIYIPFIRKFVYDDAPYIFWSLDVYVKNKTRHRDHWHYTIDALTGYITKKIDRYHIPDD